MHLSIVIPAYNEGKVLKTNLEKIIQYLKGKKYTWEIIVIDDGSKDFTYKIANSLGKWGVKAYKLPQNQGKGRALKEGFNRANGEYMIFMDADLSVPLKNIDTFLSVLKDNKVVIGSRRISGSNIIVHQSFIRENMGRVFTLLTKIVTSTDLADYTCGFKGFEKRAGKKIFGHSQIKRWSYDAEIMFLANKFGYKIQQVPVEWFNRIDSRVRLGDAVITSFLDLIKIRVYDLLSKYDY
jgi:dolichyl-phosphate beta-glucosyltransferase